MADYSGLTDSQLAQARQEMQGRVGEYGQRAQDELRLIQEELARRVRAAELADQAAFEKERDSYSAWYKELPGRLEKDVRSWRPPPHPRPDEAFDAELSPQIANWTLSPIDKPLVKTQGQWNRDQRAAELARQMQAERRRAEERGPVHLAAFDQALPGIDLADTEVPDTWQPGLEPWGGIAKGMAIPSAFGSTFAGVGELVGGQALQAAGVPNKSADEAGEVAMRTAYAADDALGNIPTGVLYGLTGNRSLAPGYMREYWDEVARREQAPLYTLRPGPATALSPHRSHDAGNRVMDYSDDMLKGGGLSENAKMGVGLGAALLAGTATDVFMPILHAKKALTPLRAAGLMGQDVAYGAGLQGAVLGSQLLPQGEQSMLKQAYDQYYEDLMRSRLEQNRITP